MSDDEAPGDGGEVVFDAADEESDEPNVLELAGTALPEISAGLSVGALASLTGQLDRLVASDAAVLPANIFQDSLASLGKMLDQLDYGPRLVATISPALSVVAGIMAKNLRSVRDFARKEWPPAGAARLMPECDVRIRSTVGGWPMTSLSGTGTC